MTGSTGRGSRNPPCAPQSFLNHRLGLQWTQLPRTPGASSAVVSGALQAAEDQSTASLSLVPGGCCCPFSALGPPL